MGLLPRTRAMSGERSWHGRSLLAHAGAALRGANSR